MGVVCVRVFGDGGLSRGGVAGKPYLEKVWRPPVGFVASKTMFFRLMCRFWTSRLRRSMFGEASPSAPFGQAQEW